MYIRVASRLNFESSRSPSRLINTLSTTMMIIRIRANTFSHDSIVPYGKSNPKQAEPHVSESRASNVAVKLCG